MPSDTDTKRGRLWRLLALGPLLAMLAGCQRSGNLEGKVTYKERPLAYGTVLVVTGEGHLRQGTIEEDGTYFVENIPVGTARIAVNSPDPCAPLLVKPGVNDPDPNEQERRKVLRKRWFVIPNKFGRADQSGLTVDVNSGGNSHNITLD